MERKKTPVDIDETVKEIDLFELFRYLLRRLKSILSLGLAGMLIAALYAFVLVTPLYEATAQLYVVNSKESVVDLADLQIGSYLTSDYQLVFNTWEVNQEVIMNLDLPYSVKELREMVTVTNPSDTRALFITVRSADPAETAVIANEFASVASEYISNTMLTDIPTTLSVALEPVDPVSPNKLRISILGALLGLVLAIGVHIVRFALDDKVKTSSDVLRYTGALPLAVIPLTDTVHTTRRTRG